MADTHSRMETRPAAQVVHDQGRATPTGVNSVAPFTAAISHPLAGAQRAAEPILEPADLVPEMTIKDMVAAGDGAELEPLVLPKARVGIDLAEGPHEPEWATIEDIFAIPDLPERAFVVLLNAPNLVKDESAGPLFESVREEFIDGACAWAAWVSRHNPPIPPHPEPKRRPRPKPQPDFVSADFVEGLLGEDAPAYLAALKAKYAAKKGGRKLVIYRNKGAAQ